MLFPSSSSYFCHPIAIRSSLFSCFFNVTSFSVNREFIFVSQTFLGWGLLGNGCMKGVSRARRDVWLWKGDKNSQTPNIALLLYIIKTTVGKSSSIHVYWILLQPLFSDSTFLYRLHPFCHIFVRVWEWNKLPQRVQGQQVILLSLIHVVKQTFASKHICRARLIRLSNIVWEEVLLCLLHHLFVCLLFVKLAILMENNMFSCFFTRCFQSSRTRSSLSLSSFK